MDAGIAIAVVWADADVVEAEVSAANGPFAATIRMYVDREAPARWAAALAGFPASRDDRREIAGGASSPALAGGEAVFQFAVRDAAGHGAVAVRLRADERMEEPGSAEFVVHVEAAAVDRFVVELRGMSAGIGQRATLAGIQRTVRR